MYVCVCVSMCVLELGCFRTSFLSMKEEKRAEFINWIWLFKGMFFENISFYHIFWCFISFQNNFYNFQKGVDLDLYKALISVVFGRLHSSGKTFKLETKTIKNTASVTEIV